MMQLGVQPASKNADTLPNWISSRQVSFPLTSEQFANSATQDTEQGIEDKSEVDLSEVDLSEVGNGVGEDKSEVDLSERPRTSLLTSVLSSFIVQLGVQPASKSAGSVPFSTSSKHVSTGFDFVHLLNSAKHDAEHPPSPKDNLSLLPPAMSPMMHMGVQPAFTNACTLPNLISPLQITLSFAVMQFRNSNMQEDEQSSSLEFTRGTSEHLDLA